MSGKGFPRKVLVDKAALLNGREASGEYVECTALHENAVGQLYVRRDGAAAGWGGPSYVFRRFVKETPEGGRRSKEQG